MDEEGGGVPWYYFPLIYLALLSGPRHYCEQQDPMGALARCELSQKQVEMVWRDLHSSLLSMAGQEARYKILIDWYRYPAKLHRIFPDMSPNCWTGCPAMGDARHIWWECPVIQPFWQEVANALKDMLGYPIVLEASLLVLGVCHPSLKCQSWQDKN